MHVNVYSKPGCHLCEDALQIIDRMTAQYGLDVTEVNILDDMEMYEQYRDIIPVVEVTDVRVGRLVAPITEPELQAYFTMAQHAILDRSRLRSVVVPYRESALDRLAASIGRHWLRLVLIAMGIFSGLPWLAPIFAALGWWDLANPLYTAYALTCHQLPERAGSVFGYQVAFCYRNTALYAGVFLFGIIYGLARDRGIKRLSWITRPLVWWGFVLMILPLVIDGITHTLGLRDSFDWTLDSTFGSFYMGSQPFGLNWWLRIITGLLAAFGTVWFAFPRMQRAIDESEALRQMYKSRGVPLASKVSQPQQI
ncbi:MAG: DUF2085 domain-containing protein [Chloroflexota bacterium]